MKIKNRLRTITIFSIFAISLMGLLVLLTHKKINKEIEDDDLVSLLVREINELEILSYEYLLHPVQRVKPQWESKQLSIIEKIRILEESTDHPKDILTDMKDDLKNINNIFKDLFLVFQKYDKLDIKYVALSLEYKEILSGQLMSGLNKLLFNSLHFSSVHHQQINIIKKKSLMFIILSVVIIVIVTGTLSFMTSRSIKATLNRLNERLHFVGVSGPDKKIAVQLEDEIVEFTDSFNQMVHNLKKSREEVEHLASFPQLDINPIIETDSFGNIIFYNNAAVKLLNSKGFSGNYSVFLPDNFNEIIELVKQQKELQLFREVKIKDLVFRENIYWVPEFDVIRIYTRDITDHRKSEEHILRLNQLKEKLLGFGNLDKKLNIITGSVVDIFAADFCRIWIVKEGDKCNSGCIYAKDDKVSYQCYYQNNCLHLSASSGRYTHISGSKLERIPFGCYKIGEIAVGLKFKLITNNVLKDRNIDDPEWAERLGLVSFAGYRIVSTGGVLLGVLALFSKHIITPGDDVLLESLVSTTSEVVQTTMAQHDLEVSKKRYDLATMAGQVWVWDWDLKTNYIYIDPVFKAILGYEDNEIGNNLDGLTKLVHPVDLERFKTTIKVYLEEYTMQYNTECKMLCKDGSFHWVLIRGNALRDKSGKPYRMIGTNTDITKRKMSEIKIEHLASFPQMNINPIIELTSSGSITFHNKSCVVTLKKLGRVNEINLFLPEDIAGIIELLNQKKHRKFYREVEIEGYTFAEDIHLVPKFDVIRIYMSDITEKKQLQAEAIRSGQLIILGELSACVAHEINSPINGVINCAQLLLDEFINKNLNCDLVNRIIKESDRIANVTKCLLSFGGHQHEEKLYFNIKELLSDVMTLIGVQMRRDGINININININPNIPEISGYVQQLQQVFMNVMNNARYALNEKYPQADENKTIDITVEKVTINKFLHIQVIFCDQGIGIPENRIDKILNPFFTTKPRGKGNGLGLSISNSIINDHEGRIEIESVEGEFTKVIISLPVNKDDENIQLS